MMPFALMFSFLLGTQQHNQLVLLKSCHFTN
uniref:Uncharacterized protein n=1 Tax=Rhizophora mucronata TaxID=61149 RepID=A0A2P2NL84_RHIMU